MKYIEHMVYNAVALMRINALYILSLIIILMPSKALAQPLRAREGSIIPTPFGSSLLIEREDFRLTLYDYSTLHDRISRGVVLIIKSGRLDDSTALEYSTNKCKTVLNALQIMGITERKKLRPQIRIIQRDSIIQSAAFAWTKSSSGFSDDFMKHEIHAGDIVVCTSHLD